MNAWAGASGFVVVTVRAWTAEGRRIGSWEGGCKRKQPHGQDEEERDGLHHEANEAGLPNMIAISASVIENVGLLFGDR